MVDSIQVPAIGFSTTVNVDGDRQMVFQGYFEQGEPDDVVNARIDRIMLLADRQRSKYKLPALREELQKLTDELAQYKQDVDEAELNFQKAQAGLDIQIVELMAQKANLHNEGAASHAARGKVSPYKPAGHVASSLQNIEKQVADLKDRKASNEAEKKVHYDNVVIAIDRRQARVQVLQEQIADLERLFGG